MSGVMHGRQYPRHTLQRSLPIPIFNVTCEKVTAFDPATGSLATVKCIVKLELAVAVSSNGTSVAVWPIQFKMSQVIFPAAVELTCWRL
jgi:hypothetical protein